MMESWNLNHRRILGNGLGDLRILERLSSRSGLRSGHGGRNWSGIHLK